MMSNDDEEPEEISEDSDDEGGGKKEQGGQKRLIILVVVGLMLIAGGTAAAYFTSLIDPFVEMIAGSPETSQNGGKYGGAQQEVAYYDLPEVLVNMNTSGRKAAFLKIRVSLELISAKDVPKVAAVMPRIIDDFQVFLRELRFEDLKGSLGIYRLRGELLARVSAAAAPAKVNDVLFKEIMLQ